MDGAGSDEAAVLRAASAALLVCVVTILIATSVAFVVADLIRLVIGAFGL